VTGTKAPVVLVHGLWLHASSWAPWQERFAEAGYASFAPGWPGDADTVEGCRADPDSIANHGIDDVTSHYAAFIDQLTLPEGRAAELDLEERAGPGGDRGEQAGGLRQQLPGVETGGGDLVPQEDRVGADCAGEQPGGGQR